MRKARIQNNTVVEILNSKDAPFPVFHSNLIWVECDSTITVGYTYDGVHFNPSTIDPKIAIRKQIKDLENGKITDRMRDEALLGSTTIISTDHTNEFYNMTSIQAIASIRSQIATLRTHL